MKKRLWLIVIGILTLAVLAIIYWFYFSKPTSFPTNGRLIEEMNNSFPSAAASEIQDTISVDDHNVLVPFISKNDDYSLSYWVWKRHKWRIASIDTTGTPMLWKVDRNHPSSYRVVWNIHPEDQLSYAAFYLRKDRGYHIIKGIEHYEPGVQMMTEVSFEEKSYGMFQLSEEWAAFMDSLSEFGAAKQEDTFYYRFFPEQYMSIGWIPYDEQHHEAYPERSVNGSGFSNEKVYLDYLRILDESEIEISKQE
ncbi:hypothetical protein [Oceanobacillus jordanicus]|uniref:Uncharacterized protein n=1 Tax=Oceanobacillus jordanicus TaxID=2867266 RepID=A0AAW5B5W6_9BACI|nr:hypothetical protein [Oceanobacillus jordanicus]MCG3419830.1 hypothetical protein [Oceanobacillus jordanicus]